jgi:hypothetical protein
MCNQCSPFRCNQFNPLMCIQCSPLIFPMLTSHVRTLILPCCPPMLPMQSSHSIRFVLPCCLSSRATGRVHGACFLLWNVVVKLWNVVVKLWNVVVKLWNVVVKLWTRSTQFSCGGHGCDRPWLLASTAVAPVGRYCGGARQCPCCFDSFTMATLHDVATLHGLATLHDVATLHDLATLHDGHRRDRSSDVWHLHSRGVQPWPRYSETDAAALSDQRAILTSEEAMSGTSRTARTADDLAPLLGGTSKRKRSCCTIL